MSKKKKTTFLQGVYTLVHKLTAPIVYGLGVTITLSLYFAIFKHGDISDFPRLFKFVSTALTPWFMIGYSVARHVLPEQGIIRRAPNLLLPVLEGVLAVIVYSVLYVIGGELDNHYANTALEAGRLIASVVAARLAVRRVFRF